MRRGSDAVVDFLWVGPCDLGGFVGRHMAQRKRFPSYSNTWPSTESGEDDIGFVPLAIVVARSNTEAFDAVDTRRFLQGA
jgi:hypothetical protein